MNRLDLDDLPPKIAAQLIGVTEGEQVLLVQNGLVVGRLVGARAEQALDAEPTPAPEEHMKQVFDDFRSAVEDEF